MDIKILLTEESTLLDAIAKSALPENNKDILLERRSPGELAIEIRNAKLSSIYSITDEFLKIVEIVKKIYGTDYS